MIQSSQTDPDVCNPAQYVLAPFDLDALPESMDVLPSALLIGRIETNEPEAIAKEAATFVDFFDDPDASDLLQDLNAKCFSSEADLIDQLQDIIKNTESTIEYNAHSIEKDTLNRFLGFCAGIVCDSIIQDEEIIAIRDQFISSEVLKHSTALVDLQASIFSSLRDNFIDEQEREEIHEWLEHLVGDGYVASGKANIGNVAELDEHETDASLINFYNSYFVVTGPTAMGTRSYVASLIEEAGGHFQQNVTQRTNYIVVADSASKHWRTTHFGTKLQRAHELIEKGLPLKIVSESTLQAALLSQKPQS